MTPDTFARILQALGLTPVKFVKVVNAYVGVETSSPITDHAVRAMIYARTALRPDGTRGRRQPHINPMAAMAIRLYAESPPNSLDINSLPPVWQYALVDPTPDAKGQYRVVTTFRTADLLRHRGGTLRALRVLKPIRSRRRLRVGNLIHTSLLDAPPSANSGMEWVTIPKRIDHRPKRNRGRSNPPDPNLTIPEPATIPDRRTKAMQDTNARLRAERAAAIAARDDLRAALARSVEDAEDLLARTSQDSTLAGHQFVLTTPDGLMGLAGTRYCRSFRLTPLRGDLSNLTHFFEAQAVQVAAAWNQNVAEMRRSDPTAEEAPSPSTAPGAAPAHSWWDGVLVAPTLRRAAMIRMVEHNRATLLEFPIVTPPDAPKAKKSSFLMSEYVDKSTDTGHSPTTDQD